MKDENKNPEDFFSEAEETLDEIEDSESVREEALATRELDKYRRRIDKLEVLINVTRSLNSTLNLNELLADIIDSIIRLADTDRGFLMLENKKGEMAFRIARDRNEKPLKETDFEVSHSIINDAVKKGEPLFIGDLLENEQFRNKESVINLQLRTAICVPLKLDGKVIGAIYTDASRLSGEITQDDISIVSAFASQAAIAIENARLHGALVISRENLARENRELRQELSGRYSFSGIIAKSKPMLSIFDTIEKIAPFDTTVLITGETGTGKELIARAIHHNSPRSEGKLVTINCGAMPGELLESELFGHKKGSFTGAASDKEGLFEAASGGTIFLDEIGEMPQELQVKLLRVLQEGEIRRVGENINRKVDVRILAATNRDLSGDVEGKRFRSDLYYRLNVVPIQIPPLRERTEDILPLSQHFLEKYISEMDKEDIELSPDAGRLLLTYGWPGNVRELENIIERAVALSGDSLLLTSEYFPQLKDRGSSGQGDPEGGSLKDRLNSVEKRIISEALSSTDGNVTEASRILNVSRQQLHNKIKKYGIDN